MPDSPTKGTWGEAGRKLHLEDWRGKAGSGFVTLVAAPSMASMLRVTQLSPGLHQPQLHQHLHYSLPQTRPPPDAMCLSSAEDVAVGRRIGTGTNSSHPPTGCIGLPLEFVLGGPPRRCEWAGLAGYRSASWRTWSLLISSWTEPLGATRVDCENQGVHSDTYRLSPPSAAS